MSQRSSPRSSLLGRAGCCLILAVLAGSVQAQTLREAVAHALKTNPEIGSSAALARAAREEVDLARSGYFPSVDLNAGWGKESTDTPVTRTSGASNQTLDRQESGVLITQTLFDGFATRSEVRRQQALFDSAQGRLSDTRENVALRIAAAYLQVLRNRELVRLAEENVRAHEQTFDKVGLRVKAGVSQRADQQQAEGRLALARSTLIARRGALREAEANYNRLVGKPPGDLERPADPPSTLVSNGRIDSSLLTAAIRKATDTATESNPALAAARAELAAADAAVEGAKAPYMPRLNLEVGANRNRNVSGLPGLSESETAMVVMRWNVFRGGADAARERALAQRKFAAQDAVASVRREIEERVAVALNQKATTEERLGYLREHVRHSGDVLRSYQQQLELGRRSLLDVLNGENELFNARSNLVTAQFEDILSQFSVEAAKGRLLPTLGIAAVQ